jgi:hypothetical protein
MRSDIFNRLKESSAFFFDKRYSANIFYNIIPDTEAAGVSTAGESQV